MKAAVPAWIIVTVLGLSTPASAALHPLVAAYCQARCFNAPHVDHHCTIPCDENPTSELDCSDLCQAKNVSCFNSCHLVRRFSASCPTTQSAQCLLQETNQGQTIQLSVPSNITLKEHQSGRSVHITWTMNLTEHQRGILVFVLQMRWSLQPSVNVTEWETLTKTTASTIILKEVLFPGRWYEFRIAAVSFNGTKGFSDKSAPFILSVFPRAPGPPHNLREDTEHGHYPTIRWEPPTSDLPIEWYRVTWSQRNRGFHGRPSASMREHQRILPANRLKFTMKQLERRSTFLVQVEAIARFRNQTLNGQKATIYVNTFSLKATETKLIPSKIENLSISELTSSRNENYVQVNVSWSAQELEKHTIKFVIRWNAETCVGKKSNRDVLNHAAVTQITTFTLSNLIVGCRYAISVHATTKQGTAGEASVGHITLSCNHCHDSTDVKQLTTSGGSTVLLTSLCRFLYIATIIYRGYFY